MCLWCASVRRNDSRSAEAQAYRKLYKTAAWQRIRNAQLAQSPLCEWCLEQEMVTEASEVHHTEAFKGDLSKFYSGPFVSTCKSCHSRHGQREDHGRKRVLVGVDGYPVECE